MSAQTLAGRRGRMIGSWYRQELLLLIREPVAIFFSLAFPLVIYVFIGMPYANEVLPDTQSRFIDVMFPSLVGTVSANLLLMGLPIYIAELRTRQVDKRYRSIPLPGSVFGVAVVLSMLTLTALASAVIILVVGLRHGLRSESVDPIFLLLNLGLIAFLCAAGFFLGTLPFGSRTIQAASAAVFFILFFGSGAAAPLDALPSIVQNILEWNPLKVWFDALVSVYTGSGLPGDSVWKMCLTLVVGCVLGLIGLRNWRRVE
ncbi:ABC transporter permease [Devriesea agamarum]|uniref:ABC transporter permease n=1 Tax=Devriesea agamarum TaxID=472569 RepID=UPI00071C77C3|nr:ABC transporter permease [Devriesea agamarum]